MFVRQSGGAVGSLERAYAQRSAESLPNPKFSRFGPSLVTTVQHVRNGDQRIEKKKMYRRFREQMCPGVPLASDKECGW